MWILSPGKNLARDATGNLEHQISNLEPRT